MTDSEFLKWIHARLEHRHGEDPLYDYMQKLKQIADKLEETEKREKETLASLEKFQREQYEIFKKKFG